MGQKMAAWLREVWEGAGSVRELIDAPPVVPVALVGDADDIFLSLLCDRPYSGANESVATYLEALREDLKEGRISEYIWVPTDQMTAAPTPCWIP